MPSSAITCGKCLHSFDIPNRTHGPCRCPHCGGAVAIPPRQVNRADTLTPFRLARLLCWCCVLLVAIFPATFLLPGVSRGNADAAVMAGCGLLAVYILAKAFDAILDVLSGD